MKRVLATHGPVRGLAFSPDDSLLAASGESKVLDVWTIPAGQPVLAEAPSFSGPGASLGWLPDGHTVVHGAEDGRATMYDVDAGRVRGVPLPAFRDGGDGVVWVAPTVARTLSLVSGPRPAYVPREGVQYPVSEALWLAHACALVGRDPTRSEWRAYLPGRPWAPTCTDL